MTTRATVNYHYPSARRQAYHIDAGGVAGAVVSPPHDVVEVAVADMRVEGNASFEADSVALTRLPSSVTDFPAGGDWTETYDRELAALLARELGASEVIVFDHTVRRDDPHASRKPARNVHSDYSSEGAHRRLRDIVGDDAAPEWEAGRFAFVNVWRPVAEPIRTAPLGFVRPSSVAPEDWQLIDLVYPDRRGHIMGLSSNPAHQWIHWDGMTPDEVVFFNIYDNRGRPSVAHSALDLVDPPVGASVRQSIESRTLVRIAA